MTLTAADRFYLESNGYKFETINVNGQKKDGYINYDYDFRTGNIEFYEHGSGDEFEPPVILHYNQNEEYYVKVY